MTNSNENSNPEDEFDDNEDQHENDDQSWDESSADELPGFSAKPGDAEQDKMSFEEHSQSMIGRVIGPYRLSLIHI